MNDEFCRAYHPQNLRNLRYPELLSKAGAEDFRALTASSSDRSPFVAEIEDTLCRDGRLLTGW